MLTRRSFLMLSGGALALAAMSTRATGVTTGGGAAFGSYWRLSLAGQTDTANIRRRLQRVVAETDAIFSPYGADSALSAFNRTLTTDWLAVPDRLRRVLAQGLEIARRSGGAFDPTVGPSVARYGFGPIVGVSGTFSELEVVPGAARKGRQDLTIDLCGIAKGHALDLMTRELAAAGIGDYLLDLGGEVACRGRHPDGRAWLVGVEAPGAAGLAHVLELPDLAVATSGLVAQGYQISGRTYGHIIDPASGEPAAGRTASVSVVAADAAFADAWATALIAQGDEAAVALAEREKLDALFLVRDGDGLRSVFTGRFETFVRA